MESCTPQTKSSNDVPKFSGESIRQKEVYVLVCTNTQEEIYIVRKQEYTLINIRCFNLCCTSWLKVRIDCNSRTRTEVLFSEDARLQRILIFTRLLTLNRSLTSSLFS